MSLYSFKSVIYQFNVNIIYTQTTSKCRIQLELEVIWVYTKKPVYYSIHRFLNANMLTVLLN